MVEQIKGIVEVGSTYISAAYCSSSSARAGGRGCRLDYRAAVNTSARRACKLTRSQGKSTRNERVWDAAMEKEA
jgi:hypothetical protein